MRRAAGFVTEQRGGLLKKEATPMESGIGPRIGEVEDLARGPTSSDVETRWVQAAIFKWMSNRLPTASLPKTIVSYIFQKAGISVVESEADESKSGASVAVHDASFYKDVLLRGSLGLGNSYIEGKWDSPSIDHVVFNMLSSGIYQKLAPTYDFFRNAKSNLINLQSKKGARKVIETHYDLPVEFFAAFLDSYLQYTCGLFEGADNLEQSQINKMNMICKKLALKPGQSVLDIGGGWGGLARFMTERYGVRAVVVTLSKEQANYIRAHHANVAVLECDYREVPGTLAGRRFDAVSAVGVFEHIGHKNYSDFMKVVNHSLRPGGRFLLHTIYTPSRKPEQNPWVEKHIFPNSELPTQKLIESAARHYFVTAQHDGFQELTPHYCKTLLAWNQNLSKALESGKIKISREEHRKWQYNFLSYAGSFKAKHTRVAQFLFRCGL
jgi:cyclopropane-fatty-acyl-phospholipid synthase